MHNIEFAIELNENGRPFISLPEDYKSSGENNFFIIEMMRYLIQDLKKRRGTSVDDKTNKSMDISEGFLGQISDEVAALLYLGMKKQGLVDMQIDSKYHIQVSSLELRDNLPDTDILYNGKLYNRMVGLKVCVISYDDDLAPIYDIYELVNGINNENWVKL